MSGWTLGVYLTALVTNLKARAELTGIQIWSAPIAKDELEDEAIAFIDIISEDEVALLGNRRRREEYLIEGVIEVKKPGMGDDVATEARDRAIALFAEVESELRANPDAGLGAPTVRFSEILNKNIRQKVIEENRRVILEFDIQVKTETAP